MAGKLESIQILRAIAALAVVLFHSHFAVASFPSGFKFSIPFISKYGYFGVDLFFVISGYIIAHITIGKKFSFLSFSTKRFFRIYPIYWIFCLLSYYLYTNNGLFFGPKDFTLSNLATSLIILPIDGSPAYGVGWSLEHEIIFYSITAISLTYGRIKHLCIILALLGGLGLVKAILELRGVIEPF